MLRYGMRRALMYAARLAAITFLLFVLLSFVPDYSVMMLA